MDSTYLFFLALAFVAAALFVEGMYLVWNSNWGPDARRTADRMRSISTTSAQAGAPTLLKKRVMSERPALDKALLAVPGIHALDRFLVQSGLGLTVAAFLVTAGAIAIAALVAVALFGAPALFAALAGIAGVIAWILFVQYRRVTRMRAIDRQLPDALELMARAMQAGHALSSAMRLVGTEGQHPIASEFRATFDEINFGMPLERALQNMGDRVASHDLRFFVEAVLIQRDTGGNLAELLVSIADLIRERQNLIATVRVLSTEARVSAWILGILPFALAGVLFFLNNDYISWLWKDPAGVNAIFAMLALMVFGIWWMWRMVKFRV